MALPVPTALRAQAGADGDYYLLRLQVVLGFPYSLSIIIILIILDN
jgi:hypothetical protein